MHHCCLPFFLSAFNNRYAGLDRDRFLRVLSVATFSAFFRAYMIAPLIPKLSAVFGVQR